MPSATPILALPYPVPADTVDVPRDVQALAEKLDTTIGAGRVEGVFSVPGGTIPASDSGDWQPSLTAQGTPTANLSVVGGSVRINARMRVQFEVIASINCVSGTPGWVRTSIWYGSTGRSGFADARYIAANSKVIVAVNFHPTIVPVGETLWVGFGQQATGATLGSATFAIWGQEEL